MGVHTVGHKLAIMQPYFLPYLGYWQLIASVDEFVIYDNIKYVKKGWINRNRMLQHGVETKFSLPLKNASDACMIIERELSEQFDRQKMLRQFKAAYAKATFFDEVFPVIEAIVAFPDQRLFHYLFHSIEVLCLSLEIKTPLRISSTIEINHELKSEDKVIALSRELGATDYINPIGGVSLYSHEHFQAQQIQLHFLQAKLNAYPQLASEFIPGLSILDVLMNQGFAQTKTMLHDYSLIA